jgi:enamine deaminase RidA (YjgF/YER057c/UK114 family)
LAVWLRTLDADLGSVVMLVSFHKDVRDVDAFRDVLAARCAGSLPAWTAVGMTGFRSAESLHAIRAVAVRGAT